MDCHDFSQIVPRNISDTYKQQKYFLSQFETLNLGFKYYGNKKTGKNKVDTVNTNYIAGGKLNTVGPPTDPEKNSSKSKTRNANGRKKEGHSTSDRTEFLKSVFL